jgi:uncharacterized protein (TIGR03437 family)
MVHKNPLPRTRGLALIACVLAMFLVALSSESFGLPTSGAGHAKKFQERTGKKQNYRRKPRVRKQRGGIAPSLILPEQASATMLSVHAAGSTDERFALGSLVEIQGKNFFNPSTCGPVVLPTTVFCGLSVAFQSLEGSVSFQATIWEATSSRIMLQLPYDISRGNYEFKLHGAEGTPTGRIVIEDINPVFVLSDPARLTRPIEMYHPTTGAQVTDSSPVFRGELVYFFANGLGRPMQQVSPNQLLAPSPSIEVNSTNMYIQDGERRIPVAWARKAPGRPGIDQVGFHVPADGMGDTIRLCRAGVCSEAGSLYTGGPSQISQERTPHALVHAAHYGGGLSVNSLVSLFGQRLSSQECHATSGRFPVATELCGISVLIDGNPMPLLYVSPTQVNLHVSRYVRSGAVMVEVVDWQTGIKSGPILTRFSTLGMGLFTRSQSGKGLASAQRPSPVLTDPYIDVTDENPARAGGYLILYGTGLGDLGGRGDFVAEFSNNEGRRLLVPVEYAGPCPGFLGLDQYNIPLPPISSFPAFERSLNVRVCAAPTGGCTQEGVTVPIRSGG